MDYAVVVVAQVIFVKFSGNWKIICTNHCDKIHSPTYLENIRKQDKMDLTRKQIEELVYDARMNPNMNVDELLDQFIPKSKELAYDDVVIKTGQFSTLTTRQKYSAWLIYTETPTHAYIHKNRFGGQGIASYQALDKYIEIAKKHLETE